MKSFKLAATALLFAASTGAFAFAQVGSYDTAWISNVKSAASAPAPVASGGVVPQFDTSTLKP